MKELKKLILAFGFIAAAQAQTSFEQDAYFSNLNNFTFFNPELSSILQFPNHWNDQQFHFRWNTHLYHGNNFALHTSLRNRLFTGYAWQENLYNFKEQLELDFLDLISINSKNSGLHHQVDRLYAQWEKGTINVRIGRQRINWGIQNYWNSHDLFNQINFLNFDYIENPGTDAIRVQYFRRNNAVEIAFNKDVQAGLYKFNLKSYDFQFILAKYFKDYTLGFGWAGQLKDAGFKGEFNYFKSPVKEDNTLVGSLSFDYSFKNGIYLSTGCLYRNQAEEFNPLNLFNTEITAKSPMPFKYNFLYQIVYPIHPLVQIGATVIHDADGRFVFVNPQLNISITESLDLLVGSQMTYLKLFDKLEDFNKIVFTRLQWSL